MLRRFVAGNAEHYVGADQWIARVEELGLTALPDTRVELPGFDLAGVNATPTVASCGRSTCSPGCATSSSAVWDATTGPSSMSQTARVRMGRRCGWAPAADITVMTLRSPAA